MFVFPYYPSQCMRIYTCDFYHITTNFHHSDSHHATFMLVIFNTHVKSLVEFDGDGLGRILCVHTFMELLLMWLCWLLFLGFVICHSNERCLVAHMFSFYGSPSAYLKMELSFGWFFLNALAHMNIVGTWIEP